MRYSLFVLLAGFAAAGAGGEVFVRAAVRLARAARVTAAIIGATVAAFATSSPELSVSVNSAVAGTPEIALGDALGSNVVNIALILALAAVIAPITPHSQGSRRDFAVALAVSPLIAVLAWDGYLSRTDGLLLLALFSGWLVLVVGEARSLRQAARESAPASGLGGGAALCVAGLALLVLAGRLVVIGAKGIGESFGLDPFVVGATMVSVGTSVPELATAVVAQLRGHADMGLGTVLGSNIFNALFIVAVAAIIRPIPVSWAAVAIGLGSGAAAMLLALPRRHVVTRRQGAQLLAFYVAYLLVLLWFGPRG